MTTRTNGSPGLEVSLFCVQLTSPDPGAEGAGPTVSNYYSGLVDLPYYSNGYDYQPMGSIGTGAPFITYDSNSGTFTVGYQINCLAADYNPSTSDFQTFMLPYYTDSIYAAGGSPDPSTIKSVTVNIYDNSGALIESAQKTGTISTIKTVKRDLDPVSTLVVITDSPSIGEMGSYIIQSATQTSQYFAILWSTVLVTGNDPNQTEVYPLMYYPQLPPFNVAGGSDAPAISCGTIWVWNTSPAWNRQIVYPNVAPYSSFPNYMNVVGCFVLPDLGTFTSVLNVATGSSYPLNTSVQTM